MKLSENISNKLRDSGIDPSQLSAAEIEALNTVDDTKSYPITAKVLFVLAIICFITSVVALIETDWGIVFGYSIAGFIFVSLGNKIVRNKTLKLVNKASLETNSLEHQKKRRFLEIDAEHSDDPEINALLKSGYMISRATHFAREGMLLEAIDDYLEAISIDKNNLSARVGLALVYQQQGRDPWERVRIMESAPKSAISKAKTASEAINYYVMLGYAQYANEHKNSALISFKKALKITDSKKYEEDLKFKKIFEKHTGEVTDDDYSPEDLKEMINDLHKEIMDERS